MQWQFISTIDAAALFVRPPKESFLQYRGCFLGLIQWSTSYSCHDLYAMEMLHKRSVLATRVDAHLREVGIQVTKKWHVGAYMISIWVWTTVDLEALYRKCKRMVISADKPILHEPAWPTRTFLIGILCIRLCACLNVGPWIPTKYASPNFAQRPVFGSSHFFVHPRMLAGGQIVLSNTIWGQTSWRLHNVFKVPLTHLV